ncbi:hypothetical protein Mapa_009163 [Marchantia paleacea]|nr:hypothetical protein Mapa_009163 [Marchantia paleacea]
MRLLQAELCNECADRSFALVQQNTSPFPKWISFFRFHDQSTAGRIYREQTRKSGSQLRIISRRKWYNAYRL